jgi:glycosyltransferase involved in cell wall biosynthesis
MNTIKENQKVIGILLTYKHAGFVEDIYRILPKDIFDEIIIFDDASRDGIEKVAEKLNLPIFIQEHNLGYGGNIKYSLKKCIERGGDYMVEIHGDGQYGADSIIPALEKMKQGYDFVLGSRFTDIRQPLRDRMPLPTYLANRGLSFIDRLILQVPLSEFHTGFRVYSRKLVETADFSNTANDDLFSFQIIAQAKYHNLKITEVPVRCDYVKEHTSITSRRAIKYSFQMFGVLLKYLFAKAGIENKLFHH